MGILKDKMLEPAKRPEIIKDCSRLVDSEVAAKRGVVGLMVKGGYKAFKAIKSGIVESAVDHLLDDFTVVLDKHYDKYLEDEPSKVTSFERWSKKRDAVMADDLLSVTDNMMERSKKKALKKIYHGLRKVAQRNVAEAIPGVGRLVMKRMDQVT